LFCFCFYLVRVHPSLHSFPTRRSSDLVKVLRLGLPAPLFTVDFEQAGIDRATFTRFFDCLEPSFGHQVSLGQSNTVVLCPALTSHSELAPAELRAAGIEPTTVRISVGEE